MKEASMQADTVLLGGTIRTMDPDQPVARALAIRSERVVAVGSDDQITALAGPGRRQPDPHDRVRRGRRRTEA